MEDDPPAGVPEWVVTYGDMMSLLLTFFIMLVSMSEVKATEKYRAVMDALQQYLGYYAAPAGPPGENFPLNSLLATLDKLGSFTDDDKGRGGVRKESVEGDDFRVLHTDEGDSFRVGEPIEFAPGDASLPPEAAAQLAGITRELAGKPNRIEIRVHTSPEPLPADCPFTDKISLTYERGRNIFKFLEQQGVERLRMRVTAAADTDPPLNRGGLFAPRYERAEVLIADRFVSEFVGPRSVGPAPGLK